MSKFRGRRPQKSPQPPKSHPQERATRFPVIGKIVAGFLAVCTILGALVIFLPRVTVDPEGSIDPSRPYPIPFKITNTGIIPLWDVQPAIGICDFVLEVEKPLQLINRCNGPLRGKISFTFWHIDELTMDERYTIRLDDAFGSRTFGGANISIIIRYKPWFLPIHREKEFRFITRIENDGHMTWLPLPIQK